MLQFWQQWCELRGLDFRLILHAWSHKTTYSLSRTSGSRGGEKHYRPLPKYSTLAHTYVDADANDHVMECMYSALHVCLHFECDCREVHGGQYVTRVHPKNM